MYGQWNERRKWIASLEERLAAYFSAGRSQATSLSYTSGTALAGLSLEKYLRRLLISIAHAAPCPLGVEPLYSCGGPIAVAHIGLPASFFLLMLYGVWENNTPLV